MLGFNALVAFALTVLMVVAVRPFASQLGLLDHPDERKQHHGAIPLVGGVAMIGALIATVLGFDLVERSLLAPMLMAVGLVVLGLIDDRIDLSSRGRFIQQLLGVGLTVWLTGNCFNDLGHLFGPFVLTLGWLAIPFTVFAMVGIVNAFNLCDGLDGLAGGIALTSIGTLLGAIWLMQTDAGALPAALEHLVPVAVAVCGAIIGFLAFNMRIFGRRRASIFMGDAGSLFLGFVIAWLVVAVSRYGAQGGLPPISTAWALLVPLFDTVGAIVRRLLEGKSPMGADRKHFHHLLLEHRLSVEATVATLVLLNAAAGAVGLLGWRLGVPDVAMLIAYVALFFVYLRVSMRAWQRIDVVKRTASLSGSMARAD